MQPVCAKSTEPSTPSARCGMKEILSALNAFQSFCNMQQLYSSLQLDTRGTSTVFFGGVDDSTNRIRLLHSLAGLMDATRVFCLQFLNILVPSLLPNNIDSEGVATTCNIPKDTISELTDTSVSHNDATPLPSLQTIVCNNVCKPSSNQLSPELHPIIEPVQSSTATKLSTLCCIQKNKHCHTPDEANCLTTPLLAYPSGQCYSTQHASMCICGSDAMDSHMATLNQQIYNTDISHTSQHCSQSVIKDKLIQNHCDVTQPLQHDALNEGLHLNSDNKENLISVVITRPQPLNTPRSTTPASGVHKKKKHYTIIDDRDINSKDNYLHHLDTPETGATIKPVTILGHDTQHLIHPLQHKSFYLPYLDQDIHTKHCMTVSNPQHTPLSDELYESLTHSSNMISPVEERLLVKKHDLSALKLQENDINVTEIDNSIERKRRRRDTLCIQNSNHYEHYDTENPSMLNSSFVPSGSGCLTDFGISFQSLAKAEAEKLLNEFRHRRQTENNLPCTVNQSGLTEFIEKEKLSESTDATCIDMSSNCKRLSDLTVYMDPHDLNLPNKEWKRVVQHGSHNLSSTNSNTTDEVIIHHPLHYITDISQSDLHLKSLFPTQNNLLSYPSISESVKDTGSRSSHDIHTVNTLIKNNAQLNVTSNQIPYQSIISEDKSNEELKYFNNKKEDNQTIITESIDTPQLFKKKRILNNHSYDHKDSYSNKKMNSGKLDSIDLLEKELNLTPDDCCNECFAETTRLSQIVLEFIECFLSPNSGNMSNILQKLDSNMELTDHRTQTSSLSQCDSSHHYSANSSASYSTLSDIAESGSPASISSDTGGDRVTNRAISIQEFLETLASLPNHTKSHQIATMNTDSSHHEEKCQQEFKPIITDTDTTHHTVISTALEKEHTHITDSLLKENILNWDPSTIQVGCCSKKLSEHEPISQSSSDDIQTSISKSDAMKISNTIVKGVYWSPTSGAWFAQWYDVESKKQVHRSFQASRHGFEKAKDLAIRARLEAIASGSASTGKRAKSGVAGISWHAAHNSWRATYKHYGPTGLKIFQKSFSTNAYGAERALKLAIEWREEQVRAALNTDRLLTESTKEDNNIGLTSTTDTLQKLTKTNV